MGKDWQDILKYQRERIGEENGAVNGKQELKRMEIRGGKREREENIEIIKQEK